MDANFSPLVRSEAVQNLVVQGNEAAQKISCGIELEGQPALRKIDLDSDRARFESSTDIRRGLVN